MDAHAAQPVRNALRYKVDHGVARRLVVVFEYVPQTLTVLDACCLSKIDSTQAGTESNLSVASLAPVPPDFTGIIQSRCLNNGEETALVNTSAWSNSIIELDDTDALPLWPQDSQLQMMGEVSTDNIPLEITPNVPYEKQKTTCGLCGTTLLRRTLARHLQNKHFQGLLHNCDHCPRRFTRLDTLDRHIREQHAADGDKIQCVYCNKIIKRRVMKSHFTSNTCLAAQSHLKNPDCQQAMTRAHENSISFTSAEYQLDIADAVMICSYVFTTSFILWRLEDSSLRDKIGETKWTCSVYSNTRYRLVQMRGHAFRSVQTALRDDPTGTSWPVAVYLLYLADYHTFGEDSPEADAHLRCLKSSWHSIPVTSRSTRLYFDEVAYYYMRGGRSLIESIKVDGSDSEIQALQNLNPLVFDESKQASVAGKLARLLNTLWRAVFKTD